MIKGQKLNYIKRDNSRKKEYITVASICLVLVLVIGGTYAYWTTTKVQKDDNKINTTCLNVTYEDTSDGITLDKTFPISDEEGKETDGYSFKITNECDSYVAYNVNLETLNGGETTKLIDAKYLDTILNDGAVVGLDTYKSTTSLLDDNQAKEARTLETSVLTPKDTAGAERTYTLRMWLDKDTPQTEENKTYKSKITVFGTPVKAEDAVEKITKLAGETPAVAAEGAATTSQLITDDTNDKNIRYIGANPNNYVDIGNGVYQTDIWVGYDYDDPYEGDYYVEYTSQDACTSNTGYNKGCKLLHKKGDPILWRIVGVMNNVEGKENSSETRIKLIRDESIGMIAWDAKCTSGEYTDTYGCSGNYTYKNNWSNASLKTTLNEAFWNRTVTTTPNYVYEYTTEDDWNNYWFNINFENTGMRKDSQSLFDDVKWHLGSVSSSEYSTVKASDYYSKEQSSQTYNGNPTTWTGMVGLMYPSDYGYATSGGTTKDRNACLEKELWNWDGEEYADCKKNNWLFDVSSYQWTMSPYASNDNLAAYVYYYGSVNSDHRVNLNVSRVRPVLYLKSGVKIVGGEGTKDNPYKLSA